MNALLDYFHPLEGLKRKRKNFNFTKEIPNALKQMIEEPYPNISDPAKDLDYIVLDLETTGLDSDIDIILSIGWVCIHKGYVDLNSSAHFYLNNDLHVKAETAVINQITPQMLSSGVTIDKAMTTFFEAAKGKVIVAHACIVEKNFIENYLFKICKMRDFPLVWLDTLCIEKKLENAISHQDDLDLTLSGTRERYGLPEYNGHNALADAISTAELLLVQEKRIDPKSAVTLGHLYKLSL